jgi:uncharacterized membrane protein YbaN (DUF454 family)
VTAPADDTRPAHDHGLAPVKPVTGVRRVVYVSLGLFFVVLAVVGVVTPLLPTTPFLLLAAYFFARSSKRLHDRLLRSRVFGGLIRDWQIHRGVRPRVKVVALTLMPCVVFTSAYFGRLPWYLVVLLISLALVGATVVIRLKTVRDAPHVPPESDQLASASIDTTTAVAVIPAAAISSTERTPHSSAR